MQFYLSFVSFILHTETTDANVTAESVRPFLSYMHCRESLNLIKGKTYLIMGSSSDIRIDDRKEQPL